LTFDGIPLWAHPEAVALVLCHSLEFGSVSTGDLSGSPQIDVVHPKIKL
jgi:hypothetical protein